MTNEQALKINGSLAQCYLFREGITERLRREHLERVSHNSTLRLLSAAETVQAINADPEANRTENGRIIHGVVDFDLIPGVRA
jgi:hypothetical protein